MERTDKQFWATVFWVGVLIIGSLFAVHCLTSCNTTHRLVKKTDKAAVKLFAKDSLIAVKTVGKYVPVKAITKTTTKYIKGKTDTVGVPVVYTVDCDSAVTATIDEMSRKHVKCPPCPPQIVRVDTVLKHDTTVSESPKTEEYRLQAAQNKKDADFYKDKYQGRTWYVWAFWIIVVALVAGICIGAWLYAKGATFRFAENLVGGRKN